MLAQVLDDDHFAMDLLVHGLSMVRSSVIGRCQMVGELHVSSDAIRQYESSPC